MTFENEKREALRLLQGIENGSLQSAETAHLVDQADPALVYLIFTWLRNHYGVVYKNSADKKSPRFRTFIATTKIDLEQTKIVLRPDIPSSSPACRYFDSFYIRTCALDQ